MIIVHDLDDSRSQRILWLLEELGVPYELRQHKRDTKSRLAPAELKRIHPLGKSPVIEDDDYVVAESGAIIDYILRKFGNGRLQPPASDVVTTTMSAGCTTPRAPECSPRSSASMLRGSVKRRARHYDASIPRSRFTSTI